MVDQDVALTEGLGRAIEPLLPSLENFLRFEQPEQVASRRSLWEPLIDEPLPQHGVGIDAVIELMRDVVVPNGLYCGAPGFSAWVTTMPTIGPIAANLAATVAGAQRKWVQSFNTLEEVALRWLKEMIGLPTTYQGIFTSGGSTANLIGLGAARQWYYERLGINSARDGITMIHQPRIYASEETHHSIRRAAAVLGLGRQAIVAVPADQHFRMAVPELQKLLEKDLSEGRSPMAVVANAGNVNTGAIDPISEIAGICRQYNLWLHIDGAYGLPGVLDPEVAPLYGDLSVAQSLVIDPHKWLAAPVGSGVAFVADRDLLRRTFTLEPAAYFGESQPEIAHEQNLASQFDDFGYPFNDFGLEQTSPARGVQVWALLKEIGIEGVRARVCRHNGYARYLAGRVEQSPLLELMAPVTLSICCFRYVPPALSGRTDPETLQLLNSLNRQILAAVRARGRCVPSATLLRSNFVIRPCYINPRMRHEDVDMLIDEVELCGNMLWKC